MAADGKVEFSSEIPVELYDEFRQYFPQYGAVTWFIDNALRCLLEEVRANPGAEEQLQLAIKRFVLERRGVLAP